ncbi:hypothetical protein HXA34_20465 [Salipaludibacillus agaradhaerens]|uniref:hypothetical protein n=1 Tax=Salipaludibacillus agaradhaerens TaxID=76935 RepID=UPI002150AEA2|nr:hypothetical protein [Salipaludibacillus agaradhaerens]MCR6108672.1 hypothetical protein [Salipaludibacillus agaradhaerens]MCR6120696.1 hypothetical protein [Salipaludibacillus agaradhaerens]
MKTVTVEYRTRKHYCHCCDQKIENPKTSEVRDFNFSKDSCLEWLSQEHWITEAEYEDELNQTIKEFVYETIGFFATSSSTKIIIDNHELEKVKKFVLEEVVA